MNIKFSDDFTKVIEYSRGEAVRTGSYGLNVDHLMLGLLRHAGNEAVRTLTGLGVDVDSMKEYIDSRVFRETPIPWSMADSVKMTRGAQSVLNMAAFEALKTGTHEIFPIHLLLAISRTDGNATSEYLASKGIGSREISEKVRSVSPRGPVAGERGMETMRFEDVAGAIAEQIGNLAGSAANDLKMPS